LPAQVIEELYRGVEFLDEAPDQLFRGGLQIGLH
jgi:hypothetical protein